MPLVTSENKADFDKKELTRRGHLEPEEGHVEVHGRKVPVTMHPVEKRNKEVFTHVDPEVFDKAFEKTNDYIGKNGKGGIGERYQKFGDFVKKADSIRASNVHVRDNGSVIFGDGRHRYAYLRDQGLKKIPMTMDKESVERAKKYGYLTK